jgi:predicted transglutaminase-like cysteine proteinase
LLFFLNPRLQYVNEKVHNPQSPEGVSDYWQTPKQSLERGLGDCDDYAIGKFFTLRTLGVPEKNLRLMFGLLHYPKEHHLNLGYVPCPEDASCDVYLADNYDAIVRPLSKRTNFAPIVAFNVVKWWACKKNTEGKNTFLPRAQNPRALKKWSDVLERMKAGQ